MHLARFPRLHFAHLPTPLEPMENLGKVKLADINAAQEAVVGVIREMEDSGELELS